MKEYNFILPIFVRWLKDNNLYWIFRRNIVFQKSKTYTLSKWFKYVNGQSDTSSLFSSHCELISQSPFEWGAGSHPCDYGIKTSKGNNNWSMIHTEWKDYLLGLKNKGLYDNKKRN